MKPKRLFVISPRDMRKNRADCVHIMKICQQFANQGYSVELVTPRVYRSEYRVARRDIFSLYGMQETFRIRELPTLLTDRTSTPIMRVQKTIAFGMFYLLARCCGWLDRTAVVYARCYISILPAIVLRRLGLVNSLLFFGKAEFTPGKWIHRFTAENVDGIMCGNQYIHDKVVEEYAIPRSRLHRVSFTTQYPEIAAHIARNPGSNRRDLGLPEDKRLVVYAGKMAPGKLEICYLIQAAQLLPEEQLVLVGANDASRRWLAEHLQKEQIRNVTVIGFQPLERLYDYVSCGDILVSYYDSLDPLSVTQRGPAKASVYLCFGKPVIMADLPSLREWWSDEQIFFVPPDQPPLLAEMVRYIIANPEDAERRAASCVEFARTNTYEKTYREVQRFMESFRTRNRTSDSAPSTSARSPVNNSPDPELSSRS